MARITEAVLVALATATGAGEDEGDDRDAVGLLEDLVERSPGGLGGLGARAFLAAAWPRSVECAERLLERFGPTIVDAAALAEAWPVAGGRYAVSRWTTRRDLVRGGIRLRRLTRYRLRARDELVVVEAEIEETPRPGAYADPDLDGTVTLEALKGTGVGRRRWTAPAAGGFATEASTEVATDLLVRARLTAPDAPPPQDRRVETTQSVSLKATPTAPPLDPPPQTGQNAP